MSKGADTHDFSSPKRIILYGSAICPMIAPVRSALNRASADFEYVNITFDSQARRRVMEINQGYASVPTLVFPDGSTLTEPGSRELVSKLEELGYQVPAATIGQRVLIWLQSPLLPILGIVALAVGMSGGNGAVSIIGGVILAASLLARMRV